MSLNLLWPKLVPAVFAYALFASVYRIRPLPALRYVAFILAVMLLRDLLYGLLGELYAYPLGDLVVLTLYVLWLRSYTGFRPADPVYLGLNALIFAAAAANRYFDLLPEAQFFLSVWLLANVAYFGVVMGLVSPLDTPESEIILRSRFALTAGLFFIHLVSLLYGYGQALVQGLLLPAGYLLPVYLLIRYNGLFHGFGLKSIQFYSSNLDATYDFMENLGNAITAKIDLTRVLEIIIASAVRNIGADAGAILMVDEYEDLLRVRATHGLYPPLAAVPELVRVTPASVKRYFAQTPIPLGETVLGQAVQRGEAVMIRDARQDERLAANSAEDILFISSLMAVPLVVGQRVLGVVSAVRRAENQFFDERDFQHLKTLAEYASITIDNIYTYTEVLEKRQIEREVDIAAEIQKKLLPARLPELEAAAVAVYNMPAKGVSGDYYDVFCLDEDKLGLAICDVAGKGIPAAMVMVMIRSILHLVVSPQRDAAATLNWVNRGITGRIDLDHFATVSFLIYDQRRREVLYANAAHLPLLVYKQKTGVMHKLDTEGLPIGIEQNSGYQQKRFRLDRGDLLILCTDGIVEAMNPQGRQYGSAGLRQAVEKASVLPVGELIDAIRDDLRRFVGTARQHDDQTLLLMKAL
jgi:sigma-B regulation protein RsbU (phosphoserine phosphatase)